ncbi:MAG TPA: hypothetical protein V6C46_08385 [Coleofasciculaceae cyanobacterium]
MYIIDVTLKNNPAPLSVQRKTAEEAEILYQQVLQAMASSSQLLELTCDHQPGKKITIASSEIAAVQIAEKTAATASGRPPGFFAMANE